MLSYVFLRGVADLSVYYTFASFVASFFRIPAVLFFPVTALQAAALMLSYGLDRRGGGVLRFFPLLLSLAPALLPGQSPALIWVLLLPTVYLFLLILKHSYEPDWTRQMDILSVFWKVFLIAALFLCGLLEQTLRVSETMLPLGMPAFLTCVLLTRTLRHESAVYLRPGCKLLNLASVGVLGGVSLLLGAGGDLYRRLLSRFLSLFAILLIPIAYLGKLLGNYLFSDLQEFAESWSQNVLPVSTAPPAPTPTPAPIPETAGQIIPTTGAEKSVFGVWPVLLVFGGLLITFLLFRAVLNGRYRTVKSSIWERRSLAGPLNRREKTPETPAAAKVRAQYRKYLRLLSARKLPLVPSQTTRDINDAFRQQLAGAPIDELRELYIAARYHGKADQAAARQAAELYEEIRKASHAGEKLPGDLRSADQERGPG